MVLACSLSLMVVQLLVETSIAQDDNHDDLLRKAPSRELTGLRSTMGGENNETNMCVEYVTS